MVASHLKDEDLLIATLPPDTKVFAASVPTGRYLLASDDQFTVNQSEFDRHARLNLTRSALEVTPAIYKDFLRSQVVAWEPYETEVLKRLYSRIAPKFKRLGFTLPALVYLVKTTGSEEGSAAYTRHSNTVVLPKRRLADLQAIWSSGTFEANQGVTRLENTILHESFHLFTKNSPLTREILYSLIGYHIIPRPVTLPNVPWPDGTSTETLPNMKVTNPDAPVLDTYIELEVPDADRVHQTARLTPLVPLLLASRPYDGGVFFEYLGWYFMAIRLSAAGSWEPALSGGQPRLYPMDGPGAIPELRHQYLNRIGRNTDVETFHPDEVLAQNFVYAANLPNLDLISSLANALGANALRP